MCYHCQLPATVHRESHRILQVSTQSSLLCSSSYHFIIITFLCFTRVSQPLCIYSSRYLRERFQNRFNNLFLFYLFIYFFIYLFFYFLGCVVFIIQFFFIHSCKGHLGILSRAEELVICLFVLWTLCQTTFQMFIYFIYLFIYFFFFIYLFLLFYLFTYLFKSTDLLVNDDLTGLALGLGAFIGNKNNI